MGRPLFDPSRMAAPRRGSEADDDAPLRVRELAARIGEALRLGLPRPVRVVGEVSGLRERTHLYFDLKDGEAVVSCVAFASVVRRRRIELRDGLEVVVGGEAQYYAPSGRLSLVVSEARPVGAGALDLAFQKLCEELRALGWFEAARKRPLPPMPRRVAVVTSRSGAALQDVLDTMRRRWAGVGVVLVDARVQGEGAAADITRKLAALGRRHADLGVDAVLLTRGGGSKEDLWAFNDRALAAEIVRCPVPVVAAIGHETDVTIAELVADLRAATPTQAAVALTPDAAALREQVELARSRLGGSAARLVGSQRRRVEALARRRPIAQPRSIIADAHREHAQANRHLRDAARRAIAARRLALERLGGRLEARSPAAELRNKRQRAGELARALRSALRGELRRDADRVRAAGRQLHAVGPMAVLARGYTYTTTADGRLLRSAGDARAGEELVTTLADGRVRSIVAGEEGAGRARRPRARRRADGEGAAGQTDPASGGGRQRGLFESGDEKP